MFCNLNNIFYLIWFRVFTSQNVFLTFISFATMSIDYEQKRKNKHFWLQTIIENNFAMRNQKWKVLRKLFLGFRNIKILKTQINELFILTQVNKRTVVLLRNYTNKIWSHQIFYFVIGKILFSVNFLPTLARWMLGKISMFYDSYLTSSP
jgi:hypothetical protein